MEPLEQTAPMEASPLSSLCRNAPNGGGFRSLRPPPEGALASNAAPLPCLPVLPPPIFPSRFTLRRRDDARQIRLLPPERYPPPTGPPPRAEASPSRPLPQVPSSPPSPQPAPINHPSPLGSNPPQQPAAMMEQHPQLPFVPSSAPMIRGQEALGLRNALRTGMQLRSDDLRQPTQFPSTERQPDHHVVQARQLSPWNFPGREVVPPASNDSPVEAQWTTGCVMTFEFQREALLTQLYREYLWIFVGGKRFRLPMHLLSESPFWSALTVFESPPQGWSIPDIDPDIFTILIKCVHTASGLRGTESELNLIKLCFAFNLAKKWWMMQDRRKLRTTTYRYIVRRILGCNPNVPEDCRDLDYSHHVYRSEELYRTWELSSKHKSIQKMLSEHDMIALYCCVIPQDIWPALTARFKPEFILLLNVFAAARRNSAGVASGVDYRRWWLHYYRLAGYRDASWLSPDAQYRLFAPLNPDEDKNTQERADFEAVRARGSALVNAFEAQQAQEQQPVTPVALFTPTAPDTSSGEEFDDALEYLPSSEHPQETRRVRFAEFPQVIRFPPQIESVQMTGQDAVLDSSEEETCHEEAARAA
ncbi:uncharacterized protein TrAtP1_000206 [Trichoderma atroviride]|uniref:uncharacterized protein n=1 Tax=Hypocrea atroviridis TaxID=63577 RepID=UPI00331A6F0A|nr:hypothetical protein TrAtP1_000206 [Trichoderma atroviride]